MHTAALLLAGGLLGCEQAHPTTFPTTSPAAAYAPGAKLSLNGVSVGMTPDQVEAVLGAPGEQDVPEPRLDQTYDLSYHYRGEGETLEVMFFRHKAIQVLGQTEHPTEGQRIELRQDKERLLALGDAESRASQLLGKRLIAHGEGTWLTTSGLNLHATGGKFDKIWLSPER